ncbi:hypothetical protein CPC08DRAFT_527111 [Agrocybe pediades]|nr:hypothetical protein CPC08DRAFT_527111 [Agrocybe pediades]
MFRTRHGSNYWGLPASKALPGFRWQLLVVPDRIISKKRVHYVFQAPLWDKKHQSLRERAGGLLLLFVSAISKN